MYFTCNNIVYAIFITFTLQYTHASRYCTVASSRVADPGFKNGRIWIFEKDRNRVRSEHLRFKIPLKLNFSLNIYNNSLFLDLIII